MESIVNLAKTAGEAILEVYAKDFKVEFKDDMSPLTEADKLSNEIICEYLTKEYPDIPILSEENKTVDFADRKYWEKFWLVDPIDGTKEFVKKSGDFTVNIALVERGVPIMGVVYAPFLGKMYYGEVGHGSFREIFSGIPEKLPVQQNLNPGKKLRVVASRNHLSPETEGYIAELGKKTIEVETLSVGSSLKFCLVAEGSADYYPRLGPTMEWDTAAAHAVCMYAGKEVREYPGGSPLIYNKESLRNPWFTVG